MAILTYGREWHFFLPAERGDYGERRVYKLDLVERDLEEIVSRLERYLKYEAICSGAAVEAARADYKDVAREREIQATLPQAWAKLIEEGDELLLELVADRVESLCGYKPEPDTVAAFLASQVGLRDAAVRRLPPAPVPSPSKTKRSMVQAKPPSEVMRGIGFILDSRFYSARSAREVLAQVFTKLADRDPGFLERFAGLAKHGSKRRYLARSPEALFPNRSNPPRGHFAEIGKGWWLLVHWSKQGIEKIVKMACAVARVGYGTDLIVNLGV